MVIVKATCHWCHVMERESFEDVEVANALNANFISIKVDREERPDIDHIYMEVCQALTGHGGWPLTILMTPDKKPFYAGTYFPKKDRMGIPGLLTLLDKVTYVWSHNRNSLIETGDNIVAAINQTHTETSEINAEELIQDAYLSLKQGYDNVNGGFGGAPKFPIPHNLYFLLRYWHVYKSDFALEMVEKTLDKMYKGGIFDHIGGGFSRYSVDSKWLVPHFEKMLYDNALLAIAYLESYQATKKDNFASVARKIFDYIIRDMLSPDGGFYSAEDADSEGVEGKFYVWTPEEIKFVLGERDGELFCKYLDISENGNFEGKNIPNLIKGSVPESEKDFFENCRMKLFEHREKRIHPYKDDKLLTSWNGLMIAAMSIGGRILNEEKYIKTAEKAIAFILKSLVREDGRLMARFREGDCAYVGTVDDYAFLIWGLLELYETTFKPQYLKKAIELNNDMTKLFWDFENGGLFFYGHDSEKLITRPKIIYDGAAPSGNSVAANNYLRLARLTGNHDLEEKAGQLFRTFGNIISAYPSGYSFSLIALFFSIKGSKEIILVDNEKSQIVNKMAEIINEKFSPFTTTLLYTEEYKDIALFAPFIANYKTVDGRTTSYICDDFSCKAPITDFEEFRSAINN